MSRFEKVENDFYAQITNYIKWPVHHTTASPHYHNVYELYFLFSGSTKYVIADDMVYEISEGDIVWIPPYINHQTQPNDIERHKRLLFWISPQFFDNLFDSEKELYDFFNFHRVIKTTSRDVKLFRKYSNLLMEEYFADNAKHHDDVIKGLLLSLLVQLKRMYENNLVLQNDLSPDNTTLHNLNLLISYINTNFSFDITLETLSEQVNMNPVYISSLFKKNLGFTFKEYLVKLRIKKATQLLKNSSDSIENIAFECGFHSSNHFCKTFKSLVGMSPSMFRNIDKE